MLTQPKASEPFVKTVLLLWKAARIRSRARARHRRKLLRQKKGNDSNPGAAIPLIIVAIFSAVLHGLLGQMTADAVQSGGVVAKERQNKIVVSGECYSHIISPDSASDLKRLLQWEADRRAQTLGGSAHTEEKILWDHYVRFGRVGFANEEEAADLGHIRTAPAVAQLFGTIMFIWWFVMLTAQGEGLDLDVQRRRHPMWEWLLSHPVRPEAAFLAEMVSPAAANPVYLAAPVYWIVLLAHVYSFLPSLVCGTVIGLLFAIAAACLNKTVELYAMLKLSVRSRGALIGLMSWLGYALFIMPLFLIGKPAMLTAVAGWISPVASIFHPNLLRWLLGNWSGDSFFFGYSLTATLTICLFLGGFCILIGRRGTAAGLEGGFDNIPKTPLVLKMSRTANFGREPLYRKELLWFTRDRSALVQAILIPLTLAGMQAFNLRHLVENAGQSWSSFCGLGVISGTYFLLVLGPRSLTSEGPALWMALTWPRGLEDLLKAKARLWWYLSSIVVISVLLFAAARFPHQIWQICLIAIAWCFFGRSLAEKAVTLVNAPSSSGESQPVSRGRQWTAMLGTLAFGSGIITRNWHLAVIGVVFSSLTAAAMWENLRARLPYLFDEWSEKLPPAPTLLHSMVAIAATVEAIGFITGMFAALGGPQTIAVARAIAYGLGSAITFVLVQNFLIKRGVAPSSLWVWQSKLRGARSKLSLPKWLTIIAVGALVGVLLGLFAIAYLKYVRGIPAIQEYLEHHRELIDLKTAPQNLWWVGLLAVGFAPVAEEYLFRGLLFRALDREWGGTRALIGSAAFFAIYHSPLSWLPVGALGLANCLVFKKTGRLVPCVVAHAIYNTIVVLLR